MTIICKRNADQPRLLKLRGREADNCWGRPSRMTRLAGCLGLLLALALGAAAHGAQSVQLAWAASPEQDVTGYNIYYGGASGDYTNQVSLGNVSGVTIAGLVEGATYYFAVTAVDVFSLESIFSNEAAYVVPAGGVQLQITLAVGGAFSLTGPARIGHTYEIQATGDLAAWITIGLQMVGPDGALAFTDYNAPNYPARFYRTHDTQP